MELAKLLLKLLYLGLLYVVLYLIIKPQVQLSGTNLSVVVLSLSILFMYFSFDPVYDFMTKNEIVIQKEKKDKEEDEEDKKKKDKTTVKTEVVDSVHEESSSDYLFDHTHKFVQDKIFV